jgi:hypothetical protein
MVTVNDVYRKFGEVAESAQLLETELGTLYLEVQADEHDLFRGTKGDLARRLLDGINKNTLGQLLRELQQKAGFTADLNLLLAQALTERNRLSHSFFRDHNFRRFSEEGCLAMIADLEAIHRTILDAYKAVMLLSEIDLEHPARGEFPTSHVRI